MRGARVKALRSQAAVEAARAQAAIERDLGRPANVAERAATLAAFSPSVLRRAYLRRRREKPASRAVRNWRLYLLGTDDAGLAAEAATPHGARFVRRLRVAAGFGRRPHAEKRLAAIRRGAEERAERARLEAALYSLPKWRRAWMTIEALRRVAALSATAQRVLRRAGR